MQIFTDLNEWRRVRQTISHETSIGFVPTMGNLHQGHMSLYATSMNANEQTVASIFINPTQFDKKNDFIRYPKTLDADLEMLSAQGVHYCLLPDESSMYADDYRYQIQEQHLCQLMEGRQRPGHFTGVLTVVMKLLNLVKPNRAYFGEKDYQQLLLIREMVNSFFMDLDIIGCPIIREPSGLAYSSRNNRLNAEQRQLAEKFARIFHESETKEHMLQHLANEPIAIEYVEEHFNRRFTAVTIDDIRLIDNYALNE